jgi:predicted molibdopterin-dependent oxidoreductase YjgC
MVHGYQETIGAIAKGKIRAGYIMGSNPARTMPELVEPLSGLDFLVVQDIFPTETAKLASVVLPAASFAEVDGTFTGPGGELRRLRKAVEPLGRSKPDWQITVELARRIGASGFDYDSPEYVQREMQAQQAQNHAELVSHADLESLVLEAPTNPSEDAHFILMTGSSLYSFGSDTRTSKIPDLRYLTREKHVELNPEDAEGLGISSDDRIVIDTSRGSVEVISKLSREVPKGVLRMDLKPDLNKITNCRFRRATVRRDV